MTKNRLLKGMLCILMAVACQSLSAQKVIFPQEQQAGIAVVEEVNDGYTIGNDLFTAKFVKAEGKLTFGGCEELGLIAGSEIFKVVLGDGTEIPASAFTLVGDVATETLAGNSAAVKASRRYNGKQIKATFTHSSGLTIEWRAVLRDGSHYLRTEMDIKNPGTEGISMNSITPMMYTVQNVDGEKAPAVVGNTRGAVIASDKIFAGVETPTAYNTAGSATDLESFAFKAWTGAESFAWTPAEEEIPAAIKNMSQYAKDCLVGSRGYLIFREAGECAITLDYTGQNSAGNKKLHVLGVDVVALNGTIIGDYHYGTTGGSDVDNVYTINIPEVGAYMVRYFIGTKEETIASVGNVIYSSKVSQPTLVYDLPSTQPPYWESTLGESQNAVALHVSRAAVMRSTAARSGELPVLSFGTYAIEEGKQYYFAANAKKNNNIDFTPQYVYADGDAVKATSKYQTADNYKWTVEKGSTENGWYIKNANGRYLSYNGCVVMADEKYEFIFADDAVYKVRGAFSLKHQSDGSKYAVCSANGGTFASNWKYGSAGNDDSWCSDYILLPCEPSNTFAQANFAQVAADAVPEAVKPTYDHPNVYCAEYSVTSDVAGQMELALDYYNGSTRINLIGVEVVDESGMTFGDYHFGYSGSFNNNNIYSVVVPAGTSTVRVYQEAKSEGFSNASGDIYTAFEALSALNAESTTANYKWDTRNNNWSAFTDWTGILPEGVANPGVAKYIDHYYVIDLGFVTVEFDYSESIGASHKINTLGVQLLDLQGNVVSEDFHYDASGTDTKSTYKVVAPKEGVYILRSIVSRTDSDYNTAGDTNISFEAITTRSITSEATTADEWLDTESSNVAEADIPEGIKALTNEAGTAITAVKMSKSEYFDIEAGRLKGLYSWKSGSGSQRVNIVGVELVDLNDVVVAADYHWGWAGSAFHKNTYAVNVPQDGIYYFRYYAETNTNVLNSDIDITLTLLASIGTIDEDTSLSDTWAVARWTNPDDSEVPMRVAEFGCPVDQAHLIEQRITVATAGTLSFDFVYSGGNQRLDIYGVDLLDDNNNVVIGDYHYGYSGNAKVDKVYTFDVATPGTYTLRYFAKPTNDSEGNITIKLTKEYVVHLVAAETTPITGKWSRITTLKAGEEWNVGTVVGVIAPGQARRSFLCYSERERAVPWRAVPAYISWYEVNIDRNNAAAGREHLDNMQEDDCLPIVEGWKTQLYDKYGEAPYAFVWDDGWDKYGEWQFHDGFPNGFTNMDNVGRQMGAGQGAWLGPVGGYGTSGSYRRSYWNGKGGMLLSNPDYYDVFVNAVTGLLSGNGYDFRFFKFDGISNDAIAYGPDKDLPVAQAQEDAEAIIMAEKVLRSIKEDVFLNTTVGTWASPFWYQFTDATWRQQDDHSRAGNNSIKRENWITYRDHLVYKYYVKESPLCPINTLMTHGFIFTKYGPPASDEREWAPVVRELRCAFACGSGMVELYNDLDLTNNLVNPATSKAGELWGEIAKCMQWQRKNADVLPDIHWVGGNPWTGAKAEIYGWAAWNAKNAVLTLRNGANDQQSYTFTLREALDIPEYVKTSITLTKAFADQVALEGLAEGEAINIDTELTVTLPGSSVYVFDGVDNNPQISISTVVSEQGIATFYANEAVNIPNNVEAYVATKKPVLTGEGEDAEGTISLQKIENGIIPAKTGVVLLAEEGTYTFTGAEDDGTPVEGNMLKGYAGGAQYENVAIPADGATNYVLTVENDIAGFYKKDSGFKVYNHKAYLQVPMSIEARSIVIRFDSETGIKELRSESGNANGATYDLSGRQVENPAKGVYIMNGKKVVK